MENGYNGEINMKNSKLYACYSVPLRDYLATKEIRYELVGLNPTSKLMFWAYIRDEKLNKALKEWSLNKR